MCNELCSGRTSVQLGECRGSKLGHKTIVGTWFWREQVAIGDSWEGRVENSVTRGMRGLRKRAPSLGNWVAVYPVNRDKEHRDGRNGSSGCELGLGTCLYPLWPANCQQRIKFLRCHSTQSANNSCDFEHELISIKNSWFPRVFLLRSFPRGNFCFHLEFLFSKHLSFNCPLFLKGLWVSSVNSSELSGLSRRNPLWFCWLQPARWG